MKILIAPDSFKESLSAREAADCIEKGLKSAFPKFHTKTIPLADGGEGTLDVLVTGGGGKFIKCEVSGPLGKKITAGYGIFSDEKTAVIEMAKASGLELLKLSERNPLKTTTYGTGELIKDALSRGYRKIIVCIGGSATVDGGMGMAQALGVKFIDAIGKPTGFGGGELNKVCRIDISGIDRRIKKTQFIVATDVKNPLTGSKGAASVYGPQKGATPAMVKVLEAGLNNFSKVIKKDLGKDVACMPGAGAAGGLGAGLHVFCGAKLQSGIEMVSQALNLEQHIKNSDLVITGEGRIDGQTVCGKTISGVLDLATKHKVPVVCVAGSVTPEAAVLYKKGVIGLFGIVPGPMKLEEALGKAGVLLYNASRNIGYMLKQYRG
ncbi:MAG: glycerate kinase [Elusimicrobia bacterium RIFOXYB2_FULL_48_7]|nr:MAG: glycerate kinase [Elusimicrobia bacterium RIFOXYB2_FULL_48_7]